MSPAPAITGSAASPSGGSVETTQPQPVKEIALKVAQSEIKNIRIKSAETGAKPVEISKPVYDTLVNTITFNIEIFNEIPVTQRPTILKEFVDAFKTQYPELKDMKDKTKVAEAAGKFLKEGGGKAILATFKVMEWEASLLHGASGGRFEGKDPKAASRPEETDIVFMDPQTGALTTQKVDSRNWWQKNMTQRTGKDIRGERQLRIKPVLKTGVDSQITSLRDIAYLDKCGWANGTNIQTAENREILFKRLFSIAQARSELFSETGLTAVEVSQRLNFVNNAGSFIAAGRGAHLIGEVIGGYTPAEFTTEAHTITDQIKTATVEKLTKLKKEGAEKRVGDQIGDKITDLDKKKDMTPEEIKAEQAVIDQEVKKIQAEADLFTRKKLLPGELGETLKAKDEASVALGYRAAAISQRIDDLLKWAGDNSEPESWVAIQTEFNSLDRQKTRIQAKIDKRVEELDKHYSHEPKVDIDEIVDSKKGTTKKPNSADVDRVTNWNSRTTTLEKEIDDLRKSVEETKSGIPPKTLEEQIAEKEDLYLERKKIVEDNADTKVLTNKYKEAERLLKQKNDDKTDVDTKTTALKIVATETDAEAETRLREGIKKKGKEKESVGMASLDDQREVSALSLIKDVIVEQEKKAAMEQRLIEQEIGVYNGPDDILEVSPELKDYPEVVLHSIRLMFGPEALSSAGNTDLYQKTKALLESQWYSKIIIENIEVQNGIVPANKVVFAGSRPRGGQNVEITMAGLKSLTSPVAGPKQIEALTKSNISEATVHKIVDEIRESALGYI